jgi:phage protein D/phage baseplate assembly protein gpV
MPLPPHSTQAVLVPEFTLSADGHPLPALVTGRITRVSLTRRMDPPDNFSIELFDPDLVLVTPPLGPLREGAELGVAIGFHGGRRIRMTGTVTAVGVEFGPSGEPVVRVDGFDALHTLTRGASYRAFQGPGDVAVRDAQLVTRLADEAGLTGVADPGQSRSVPPVQNHVSDLAFLRELAAVNGYAIWVERRMLQFRARRTSPGMVELRRGDDVVSLRLRLSTSGQVSTVIVRGWDPARKEPFTAQATRSALAGELSPFPAGRSPRTLLIGQADVSSKAEAQALADAVIAGQGGSLVVGSGVTAGRPDLDVGAIVTLHGMGRFDRGRYVVTEATHTIGRDGYRTEFRLNGADVGRSGAGDAGGPGGDVSVAVGIVTDNQDPAHRGRVKVRRATAPEGELWARLVSPMAGKGRGLYFVPEIDDEVLLGFEHGHPDRPYVLGALWNGKDEPPGNDPKVRLVKSGRGHLVTLDDTEGAEKIEIADSGGKSRIVLDAASGAVTVHGGGDVTVEAPDGLLTLHGNRVELSADTSIAVKANSTLDLAGQGPATLKGATVDIN